MKDKNTIINQMIMNAADVMEAKIEYNEIVVEMFEEKGDTERVKNLRDLNVRIAAAIATIRENDGCWT